MSRMLVCGLFAVCLVVGGCGKATHESVRKDGVGKMKEMVEVLKGVKDEASAKSAAPKLKAIAADVKKLKEQDDALPKLSKEEEKALDDKFKKEADPILSDLMKEMMRLGSDEKIMAVLKDAMQDMQNIK